MLYGVPFTGAALKTNSAAPVKAAPLTTKGPVIPAENVEPAFIVNDPVVVPFPPTAPPLLAVKFDVKEPVINSVPLLTLVAPV